MKSSIFTFKRLFKKYSIMLVYIWNKTNEEKLNAFYYSILAVHLTYKKLDNT